MKSYKKLVYEVSDIYNFDSYGGVNFFDLLTEDFLKEGYRIGDMVKISFLDKELIVPVVRDFNQIELEHVGLTISNLDAVFLKIFTFGGIFSFDNGLVEHNDEPHSPWKLKEGLSFPIVFTIEMYEPGGYDEDLKIYNLERTCLREDYSELNDEEYANFRAVNPIEMKPYLLFRGSSGINPKLNRNKEIDNALEKYHIKTILNYVDKEDKAIQFRDFSSSYYSKTNVCYMPLPVYFFDNHFTNKVRDSLIYLVEHQGPYFIHCWEGKDRTGFVVAIIECLCGVALQEIQDDYCLSFVNYFKVKRNSKAYIRFRARIVRILCLAFQVDKLDGLDFPKEAHDYLIRIGLDEIQVYKLVSIFKK